MRKASTTDDPWRRARLALYQALLLGTIFAVWYLMTEPVLVSEEFARNTAFFFGKPVLVLQRTIEWFVSGKIYEHLLITLVETLLAFAIGTLFGLGAGLAGLAGLMVGPIASIESGMGDRILILTLVVIVVGGIGSIRGAFYAALMIGVIDTVGRIFLPTLLRAIATRSVADAAGPALASMLIYLLMAIVLAARPQGLFPVRHG